MRRRDRRFHCVLALAVGIASTGAALAQVYTTPNTTTGLGPVSVSLGTTEIINYGLQGAGRISASFVDAFGDTYGSVSGLQIGNWQLTAPNYYTGTFYTLPDRGFNNPATGTFSDFAGRIQQVDFSFTPYTGAAPLGGTSIAEKLATQNQIATIYKGGTRFTYTDGPGLAYTTGLDPARGAAGTASLFGQQAPYVQSQTINGVDWRVNQLALDAEGLILKRDGSGYVSDEYGPNIYYFDANKKIVGALTLPEAVRPYGAAAAGGLPAVPATQLNFNSVNPPLEGRRNNQGMEGIALSPDGTKLYAMMQSATMQDSTESQQTRLNTRLLVYTVGAPDANGVPTHTLSEEYALKLPIFRRDGNGGAPNRTAAQSEIIALGDGKLLVLSRDGNGLGSGDASQAMFKSVLLVDTEGATNFAGTGFDAKGAAISPGGTLDATITPMTWVEALNMLNTEQLAKFNFNLNNSAVDRLTLSEKWEGLALVPALDPTRPNDYFLFIANDNDFQTTNGIMQLANGDPLLYDASAGVPSNLYADNDTVFLAYRITINPVPEPGTWAMMLAGLSAFGLLAYRRRRTV